jgi:hypothetical protein
VALTPGIGLGPYEIRSALCARGTREVYRATDTKLTRQVSVKIPPSSLAAGPDRLACGERDLKTPSLNPAHVAEAAL